MWFLFTQTETLDFLSQIVKIFSEDGMGKVVEIPANMTARDLCQLLVYKSHCVDDNSWALVEHHPLLGLGKEQSCRSLKTFSVSYTDTHTREHTWTGTFSHTETHGLMGGLRLAIQSLSYRCIDIYACMHACMPVYLAGQLRRWFLPRCVFKHECMLESICMHEAKNSIDLIQYHAVAVWKVAVADRRVILVLTG